MLSVYQACAEVRSRSLPLTPRRLPLLALLGCRLAEPISADRDSPPFDKSLVDGFAVRSADFDASTPPRELRVVEDVMAGSLPALPIGPGEAAAVMTGAPLPPGADAVVMREECQRAKGFVHVRRDHPVSPGMNRLAQGSEMRAGDLLLEAAHRLGAVDLGLLASVGAAAPLVFPRARLGILATGDEIVPWDELPGPAQIRNSNSAHLHALAVEAGAEPVDLGIARDERGILSQALRQALHDERLDVLLISGGVSVGDRDLVPATLAELGVEPVFHKVSLKPGKPIFFGTYGKHPVPAPARREDIDPNGRTLIFGLPGNPVSTIVGFLLFVRPALEIMGGGRAGDASSVRVRLASAFQHRGPRTTFHPCRIVSGGDSRAPWAEPLQWLGSPDLRTISRADGFARLGPGDREHEPGEEVQFLPIRPCAELALSRGAASGHNQSKADHV
jgi:molybdopterin molybdotransferase